MSRSFGAGFSLWFFGTTFIDQIFSEILQPIQHSCNRSLCISSRPSFLFSFSVSVGPCCRFPRSSSLVLPLLSSTEFSVYLLTSNTESCDEYDDEVGVGVAEEDEDKPGTTNGT